MKLNVKAADLKRKLFGLINEVKDLALAAHNVPGVDAAVDAREQLDDVACKLASVYEDLPALFVDAYCDTEEYAIEV